MPDPSLLPARQRAVLDAQAVAEYDTSPASALRVPLSRARVAVVTTAGLHLRDDRPFVRADPTFRVLPSAAGLDDLVQSHSSIGFDRTATARDPNVVYPLDRLRELVDEGVVGELAPRFVSFMGAQTDPEAVLDRSIDEAADLLLDDGVDVAVLTPT